MGEKKVENIRKGIETRERARGRVSAAGSLRRMKGTVGDIDILADGSLDFPDELLGKKPL